LLSCLHFPLVPLLRRFRFDTVMVEAEQLR
jgi:hypothetical protein